MGQKPMFVIGCHRSGTSLVAGILAAVLPESRLAECSLPSALDNPAGFFESEQLVAANDRLLAALGATWHQPPLLPVNWTSPELWPLLMELRQAFASLALGRGWVDKDPRLAITVGAYQHILLRRVGIVAVLRDPLEVAQSLWARDGLPLAQGLVLWFIYNLQLASHLQPDDLVLGYAGLQDGEPVAPFLERLAAFVEREAGVSVAFDQLQEVLQQQFRSDLQRSRPHNGTVTAGVAEELLTCCQTIYHEVLNVPFEERVEVFNQAFGELPSALIRTLATQGWQAWPQEHQAQRLLLLQEQLDVANQRVQAVEASTSWRLTSPLRWLAGRVAWGQASSRGSI